MKTKNLIKIILDTIMLFLLVLMYKKNVLGLAFHEIGGLIACGLFLIHKGLNWKWITKVSSNLFKKGLPAKTRFAYIIDALLFFAVTFIAVSGIFISEIILTNISSNNMIWKIGHPFASALALLLLGIHLGLHWAFVKQMFKKIIRVPKALQKPLTALCLTAILLFGGYNTANTNFSQWLASPFTVANIFLPDKESSLGAATSEKNIATSLLENPETTKSEASQTEGRGKGLHKGQGDGTGKGAEISFSNTLNTIANYLSITLMFAIITYWLEKLFKRGKRKKLPIQA